jgi:hypothetical protein
LESDNDRAPSTKHQVNEHLVDYTTSIIERIKTHFGDKLDGDLKEEWGDAIIPVDSLFSGLKQAVLADFAGTFAEKSTDIPQATIREQVGVFLDKRIFYPLQVAGRANDLDFLFADSLAKEARSYVKDLAGTLATTQSAPDAIAFAQQQAGIRAQALTNNGQIPT